MSLVRAVLSLAILALVLPGLFGCRSTVDASGSRDSSVLVTWTCTGTPCPWKGQTSSQAALWPAAAQPVSTWHGYSASHDVYAEALKVAGWTVTITAGDATVYADTPSGSGVPLVALRAGQSFTVPVTLAADEVLSIRSGAEFAHVITPGTPSTASPLRTSSVLATWSCTGTPCPWGHQTTSQAAVWPAAADPVRTRQGYVVSHYVYAKAPDVAGWELTVVEGTATVYAGTLNGRHVTLATLRTDQSFTVPTTLEVDELVSLQGASDFSYTLTPRKPTPPCTDPTGCDPVSWVASRWRYNGSGSDPGDWYGGVITWPSWSAYSTNNRKGDESRTVYSTSGKKLYPYMGEWADGCKIEVVSGGVLVIEWERGRNDWRETKLSAGDTYTIDLTGAEDGAMIETPNNSEPFSVSLSSCTPRHIDKSSSD